MGRVIQNCDVMMIIDGDLLHQDLIESKIVISKERDKPTDIYYLPNRNKYQYLFGEDQFVNDGQGSGKLMLGNLKVNDQISFRAITFDGNTDYSVIIYEIHHKSGDNVFGTFVSEIEEIKEAVFPSSGYLPGTPKELYHHRKVEIAELGTRLIRTGTESYDIYFALFKLTDNSDKHELIGYFKWDPTITVL